MMWLIEYDDLMWVIDLEVDCLLFMDCVFEVLCCDEVVGGFNLDLLRIVFGMVVEKKWVLVLGGFI